jgi:predicted SAM-dependent methyltransferase
VSRLSWLDRLLVGLRLLPPTDFQAGIVYVNLLRPFPWPDQSINAIYMGEILEHFTEDEGKRVLRECYRVLGPGGILRIRVPDHARFWKNYVDEYEQIRQQPRESWSLHHARWTGMYYRNICVDRPRIWQSMGHYHKWMYDDVSLTLLLESLNFRNVERKAFHQSEIPYIEEVEVRDDLIVEAKRL